MRVLQTHFYYAVAPGASADQKLDFILYKGQRRQKVQLSGEGRESSEKVVEEMEKYWAYLLRSERKFIQIFRACVPTFGGPP